MLPERQVGGTSIRLSILGLGCSPLANLYRAVDDRQASEVVARALQAGIRYFDTAPYYGRGLSEVRVGRALAQVHEPVVLSTKAGRLLVPKDPADRRDEFADGFQDPLPFDVSFDYSYDGVMRSLDESLNRLRVERVDMLLLHDLGALTHGVEHEAAFRQARQGAFRALADLRAGGVVEAVGLAVNEWQVCEQAMSCADFDCFLLAGRYTLLDQSALHTFLPECVSRGISVIAAAPFNSGVLATGAEGRATGRFDYQPAPASVMDRVRRIEKVCAQHEVPLRAAALQFPLAHPAVVCVLAGLASAHEVSEAVAHITRRIPLELWTTLKADGLIHDGAPVA